MKLYMLLSRWLLVKNIKITLSEKSINNAIKELEVYKNGIIAKTSKAVEMLTDYGLEICRAKIIEMNINDTGNLYNSLSGYYSPTLNAGFITVNCEYAVFVEFGTGTRGVKEPYAGQAMAETGYKYMGGTKYVTTKDGRIGWFYPADDGTWRFTEGLPSRPFMYETGIEMINKLNDIIKEAFK